MNKRLSLAGRVLAGALALAGLGYMGLLARGKMELGGASPDEQTLGRVADLNQRAMQQYCTGVVATPMGTWLVGRREGSIEGEASEFARHAPDLAASLQAPAPALSRDKEFSFISRLGANGSFELVATVPDTACLRATPDGRSVFVLTGIDRPGGANGERAQTAIFRSDDQGRSWQVLKAGLFPHHNPFQYVKRIMESPDGRAHIRDGREFTAALRDGTLPAVSFVKPDGFSCPSPYASATMLNISGVSNTSQSSSLERSSARTAASAGPARSR